MSSKSMSVGRLSIEMTASTVDYVNKLKDAEQKTGTSLNKMMHQFDKAAKGTEKSGKKINGMSRRLQDMSKSAALVTGPLGGVASRLTILSGVVAAGPLVAGVVALSTALAGMYKVISGGILVVDDTITQLSQLEAQLKLTGGAVGFTTKDLDAFARDLGLSTLTSTKEVREAMSVLATTTGLTGDAFKRTTKLAQDITQVFGGNLKSNAKLLAKALEDPADGVEKLERLNVRLTETQKEQVEQMVAAGDVYKAQTIILDEVAKKYENIASAISTETIAVQVDEMSQRWGELTEAIATSANTQPQVVSFLKSVNSMLTELTGFANPDFVMDLEAQKKASEDIKTIYGDVNSIIKDADKEKNLLGDISSSYRTIRGLELALSGLESAYESNEMFDAKSITMIGMLSPPLAALAASIETVNGKLSGDELGNAVKKFKTELSYAKAHQEQIIALHRASLTERNNISFRKQEELAKKNKKLTEKSAQEKLKKDKADAKEAKKILSDRIKNAEKKWGELANTMSRLGVDGDNMITVLDLEFMRPEYKKELLKRLGEIWKIISENEQEQVKLAEKQVQDKINAQKATELESAAGMMDAKNALLLEKYQEDLENYKNYVKGKADEDLKIGAYQEQIAGNLGTTLFNQQVENRQKEMQWLTSSLNTTQTAMESLGKEGSAAAKALFLINQGIALANATMSMNVAAQLAYEKGMALGGLPAAETARASAMLTGMLNIAAIAATTVTGVAHGGMDSVPSESSFLLQKGERVIQPKANQDLTTFLKNKESSSSTTIHAPLTVQGNVTDEKWFNQQLYTHRQMIASMNRKAKRDKPRRG